MKLATRLGRLLFLPLPLLAAEPKPHVLFMGTDLAVQQGEQFLKVQDVSGSAFMVKKGDEPVFVPMQMRSANVKIEKRLKLSGAVAQVDKLRGERAYTPGNDPQRQFERTVGAASGAASAADLARYQQGDILNQIFSAPPPEGVAAPGGQEELRAAGANYERIAEDQAASDFSRAGVAADRLRGALAEELFDAMDVSFEISSAVPIPDAYVVIISRFREKTDKPGLSRNWIYAKSIGEIGPKPRFIRVREGGFPRGFILEDYEVHLYEQGRELASNVSPRRVELSRAEAMQYLLIEHQAANKDRTVPAEPAAGTLPADLPAKLSAGFYLRTFHIRVGEAGEVRGVFTDAAGRERVTDPYLEELFGNLLFKPALVNGKPTAAMCRVHLPSLRL